MTQDIHDAYATLRKKYSSLPAFEKMDAEFEISAIEPGTFPLRQIRKQVADRVDWILQLFDGILQPDTNSFSEMYEYSSFSEQERETILALYKRAMILYRGLMECELALDDDADAKALAEAAAEWPKLRKDTLPIIKALTASWSQIKETKEMLQYLG